MDVATFLERLHKALYFEGYSEAAMAKARAGIGRRFAAGMAGPQRAKFERFPGLSLVVTDVDHEMTGFDDLKLVLKQFGAASCGMFAPRLVRIRRRAGEKQYQLEFTLQGAKQVMELEDDSWIPNAFFEQLDKVTTKHCAGLMFQAVAYPESGQSGFYLWCTARAWKAVARAGLIPSAKHPLDGAVAQPPPQAPTQPESSAASVPAWEPGPPLNPARAERQGLYRKGKWKIPRLSRQALQEWQNLAASGPSSAVGEDLNRQIKETFDLLCAIHCGLTGIGPASAYAARVIELVDRYFFGAWRVGYVEEGVKLTAKTASKALYWLLPLQAGCAAAATVGDLRNLGRFLEYICGDVYDENIADELAYYRLLSDVVLNRKRWDWSEQANLIAKGAEDRFIQLLRCLEGVHTNQEDLFQKSIRKFGAKPKFTPPLWFRGVVDCDVTVLARLAEQKSWSSEAFSVHLQDRILDRRIFA
jgi:hypothetical protein